MMFHNILEVDFPVCTRYHVNTFPHCLKYQYMSKLFLLPSTQQISYVAVYYRTIFETLFCTGHDYMTANCVKIITYEIYIFTFKACMPKDTFLVMLYVIINDHNYVNTIR